MENYRILVINPGSTSTKVALYQMDEKIWGTNIEHSDKVLNQFKNLIDQKDYRKDLIINALRENDFYIKDLSAVVGRGGMLPPINAGGYEVNQAMVDRITKGPIVAHASNLGGLLAKEIADQVGIKAYIYDAVSSDEFEPIARITGIPEINRQSFCHVLNSKAMARKVALSQGRCYEDVKYLVAHLGGGISISAHKYGRIVDAIRDDDGPFSPERSGSVPLTYIVDMCYSGDYTKEEMVKKLRGMGGMKAHLGTHSCKDIEEMILEGDDHAKLIYQAQAYQIAKGIGELSVTLEGRPEAIILTGGIAHSKMLTDMIKERVDFIAPIIIMAGESEMEALALGCLRILKGEENAYKYIDNR